MKIVIYIILIFSCISCNAYNADTKYFSKTWPENIDCTTCTVINVSDVNLAFSPGKLKYVKMLDMDGIAFSIITDSSYQGQENELVILELSESNTTGGLSKNGLYEKIGVNSLEEFFYKIHNNSISSKDIETARKIMGINDASRFVSYRNAELSAYWVESKDDRNQSLYILSHKNKTSSIQISGYLNTKIVEKILSSIELK